MEERLASRRPERGLLVRTNTATSAPWESRASHQTRKLSRATSRTGKVDYWSKLNSAESKKKIRRLAIIRKMRIAARVSIFLRSWWHKHRKSVESMVLSDEKLDFMTKLAKPEMKTEEREESLFDVTAFKADRQQKMYREARRILTLLPEYRTDKEIHYVMIALREHKQIATYPVRMQTLVAQYGFLECFNDKRAIIRQGHPPQAFYFIFYGTVAVAIDNGTNENNIISILGRGESFGELAIVNEEMRRASIISQSDVELISISKQVYEEVFMAGGSKRMTDPDHDDFIRSLDFLSGWPVHKLETDPTSFIFSYFPRGSVIVRDSHSNEWVYIIKSGSVDVMKKLEKVTPTISSTTGSRKWQPKTERDRYKAFVEGKYDEFCYENGLPIPTPTPSSEHSNDAIVLDLSFAAMKTSHRLNSDSARQFRAAKAEENGNFITLPETPTSTHKAAWRKVLNSKPKKAKISLADLIRKHVHVQDAVDSDETEYVQRLYAGPPELFSTEERQRTPSLYAGPESLLEQLNRRYKKKARLLTSADLNPQFVKVQTLTKGATFGLVDVILGQQPSLCLISNSAECLLIRKEFYRDNCPESLQRRLLQTLSPYPEDDVLRRDLLIKVDWDSKKEATLSETVQQLAAARHCMRSRHWF